MQRLTPIVLISVLFISVSAFAELPKVGVMMPFSGEVAAITDKAKSRMFFVVIHLYKFSYKQCTKFLKLKI